MGYVGVSSLPAMPDNFSQRRDIATDSTTIADLTLSLELDGTPHLPATQLVLGPATTLNASDIIVPAESGSIGAESGSPPSSIVRSRLLSFSQQVQWA